VQKVREINKTKQRQEIESIQREMGLTSVGGISLGPNIPMPPRVIRSSISRPQPVKTMEEQAA
jgi:hypothetical protein